MELFPASDDAQWELIKRVIEESDYYIVIVAGRYGSLGPDGRSYTEMEYDYAVERGIPVLGFMRDGIGKVPFDNTENSEKGRKKLEAFRQKVLSRTCRKYSSASELGMSVMKSLMAEARIRPRTGWVRSDQARSDADIQRERKLTEELEVANGLVELERTIRDRSILIDEVPRELLAQGDDPLELTVTFSDRDKKQVAEVIRFTWDELFKVIGPRMYGYILRRQEGYGQDDRFLFEDDLEEHIRAKIIDRVQNRKIRLQPSQLDSCVLQFKELGLLMFAENKADDGKVFRGITLTELGERRLTRLSTQRRQTPVVPKAQGSEEVSTVFSA
jgi:hypothetical protein